MSPSVVPLVDGVLRCRQIGTFLYSERNCGLVAYCRCRRCELDSCLPRFGGSKRGCSSVPVDGTVRGFAAVDAGEDLLSPCTHAELGLVGNLPFSVRDACASVLYVTTLGTNPQRLESVCTWWTADRIWIPDPNQAGPGLFLECKGLCRAVHCSGSCSPDVWRHWRCDGRKKQMHSHNGHGWHYVPLLGRYAKLRREVRAWSRKNLRSLLYLRTAGSPTMPPLSHITSFTVLWQLEHKHTRRSRRHVTISPNSSPRRGGCGRGTLPGVHPRSSL